MSAALSATACAVRVGRTRRAGPVIARADVHATERTRPLSRNPSCHATVGSTPFSHPRARHDVKTHASSEETVGDKVVNARGSAEEEALGLAAVRSRLDATEGCPPVDDETVIWFLRDRRLDVDAAAAKLEAFLRWRQALGPISETDIQASLSENAAYVHPHLDKEGRAVIVVEISKHVLKNRNLDAAQKHAVWAVERCLSMMADSEKGSGGIYAVWDMRGFSGANADLELAKFCILDVFREYYPKRLTQGTTSSRGFPKSGGTLFTDPVSRFERTTCDVFVTGTSSALLVTLTSNGNCYKPVQDSRLTFSFLPFSFPRRSRGGGFAVAVQTNLGYSETRDREVLQRGEVLQGNGRAGQLSPGRGAGVLDHRGGTRVTSFLRMKWIILWNINHNHFVSSLLLCNTLASSFLLAFHARCVDAMSRHFSNRAISRSVLLAVLFSRCTVAFALIQAAFLRERFHWLIPRLGLFAKSYCEDGLLSSSSASSAVSSVAGTAASLAREVVRMPRAVWNEETAHPNVFGDGVDRALRFVGSWAQIGRSVERKRPATPPTLVVCKRTH